MEHIIVLKVENNYVISSKIIKRSNLNLYQDYIVVRNVNELASKIDAYNAAKRSKSKFANKKDVEQLKYNVSQAFKMTPETLYSNSLKRNITTARYLVLYVLWINGYGSLSKIGKIFGKHHSTVLNGKRAIEDILETKDIEYYKQVKSILDIYQK